MVRIWYYISMLSESLITLSEKTDMSERHETVEEFLARGGRIERSSKIIGAK